MVEYLFIVVIGVSFVHDLRANANAFLADKFCSTVQLGLENKKKNDRNNVVEFDSILMLSSPLYLDPCKAFMGMALIVRTMIKTPKLCVA